MGPAVIPAIQTFFAAAFANTAIRTIIVNVSRCRICSAP